MEKICSKCQKSKPLSEFSKNRSRPDGLQHVCKACMKLLAEQYKERSAILHKNYYQQRKELIKQRTRNNYADNREQRIQQRRTYYKTHKEQHRELGRAWTNANREKVNEVARKSYQGRKEKHLQATRRWNKANPDKARAYVEKRRAQKHGSTTHYTGAEFQALCEKYGNICLRCGEVKPLTVDHVVPLSCGGSNDISNIQPLCLSCNSKKHKKTIDYRPTYVQQR